MISVSRRAVPLKWRRKHQYKSRRTPILNLVALMDVFTILVFFFLAHSADSGPEAHGELVNIPEAFSDKPLMAVPTVTVTGERILLMEHQVAAFNRENLAWDQEMEALLTALKTQIARGETKNGIREITIVGDQSIPFDLLNRVMQTCNQAGYEDISLAVLQRARAAG